VNEDIVIPIAGMCMIVALALGVPLIRALTKRWERDSALPKVPQDVSDRLLRMEQAIDSIAVEVERIAEGQRFTTKILAERTRDQAGLPSSGNRS
jgi:hypothetical protein